MAVFPAVVSPSPRGRQERSTTPTVDVAAGTTTLTWIDRSWTVDNDAVVYRLGAFFDTAQTVTLKLVQLDAGTTYDVVDDTLGAVSHTGSGWEFFTLSTPYNVPSSGDFYVAAYVSSIGTYKRNLVDNAEFSGDASGTGVVFTHRSSRATPALGVEY